MLRVTLGTPEAHVPSRYCSDFSYKETTINYDVNQISFRTTGRGCIIELPLSADEEIYGFGLQLKGFGCKGTKKLLRTNSDPVANTGDSHAPVPFFVSTAGYGIYLDTARYVSFYCGYGKNKDRAPIKNNTVIATSEDLYRKTHVDEPTVMAIEIPYAKGVDMYLIEDQYMLGDDLLIAPMTEKQDTRWVYLPEGEWKDFWTGEDKVCGWHQVSTENIPVYVKTA